MTWGTAILLAGFAVLVDYWAGRVDRVDLGPYRWPKRRCR